MLYSYISIAALLGLQSATVAATNTTNIATIIATTTTTPTTTLSINATTTTTTTTSPFIGGSRVDLNGDRNVSALKNIFDGRNHDVDGDDVGGTSAPVVPTRWPTYMPTPLTKAPTTPIPTYSPTAGEPLPPTKAPTQKPNTLFPTNSPTISHPPSFIQGTMWPTHSPRPTITPKPTPPPVQSSSPTVSQLIMTPTTPSPVSSIPPNTATSFPTPSTDVWRGRKNKRNLRHNSDA